MKRAVIERSTAELARAANKAYEVEKVLILLSRNSYRSLYYIRDLGYVTDEFIEQSKIYDNFVFFDLSFFKMRNARFFDFEFGANTEVEYALDANNKYLAFVIHHSNVAVDYLDLEFLSE